MSLIDKYMMDIDLFISEGPSSELETEQERKEFVLLLHYFNLNGLYIIIDKFDGCMMLALLNLYNRFKDDLTYKFIIEVYELNPGQAERLIIKFAKALKECEDDAYTSLFDDLISVLYKTERHLLISKINKSL